MRNDAIVTCLTEIRLLAEELLGVVLAKHRDGLELSPAELNWSVGIAERILEVLNDYTEAAPKLVEPVPKGTKT